MTIDASDRLVARNGPAVAWEPFGMTYEPLNIDVMPEAEVSLRVAFYLLEADLVEGSVQVGIDGAHVRTQEVTHFEILAFLEHFRCRQLGESRSWQGSYRHVSTGGTIEVHSRAAVGDVVAQLRDGRRLLVEAKKGVLTRRTGNRKQMPEWPLLRGALGQVLTIPLVQPSDVLAVAVPSSPKFEELAQRCRRAPLVQRAEIQILTVGRAGGVMGLAL